MPDFSRLSRRQKTLAVNIPYRGATGPLYLLIDSTGVKAEGEGEWHARKHGGAKRRLWRKIHIGVVSAVWSPRAFQFVGWKFHGSRSSMLLLGWPLAIASSVALR